jgi:hypothetical protein
MKDLFTLDSRRKFGHLDLDGSQQTLENKDLPDSSAEDEKKF